jgi:hypothetical protein
MPNLSAAQVWYVAHVYPERVTPEEAQASHDLEVKTEADRTYWIAAARVLNDLAGVSTVRDKLHQRVVEILKTTVEYGSLCTPGANRSEIIGLLKKLGVEGVPDA